MNQHGSTPTASARGHVAPFGSRPYRASDAVAALDSVIAGLRTLGQYAGKPETVTGSSTDFSAMVRDAEMGMPRFVSRRQRTTYNALFVAVGQRCRALLDSVHRPAAFARVTDPVVAMALARDVSGVTGGPGSTLLRMAVAAELAAGSQPPAAASNPLRGVIDLYTMGALITSPPGEPVRLTLGGGQRVALEWTGGLFSRQVAGRLRPVSEVGLAG